MQHSLKINIAKTEALRNKHVTQRPIIVEGSVFEKVQSYIYLGQRASVVERDMANEVNSEFRQVGKASISIKSS